MRIWPSSQFRYYGLPGSYADILLGLIAGNVTGNTQLLAQLEQRFMQWSGARHGLCLPRGRLGLYLALRCLIKPGQKVVLSPYTIHDVINMVICAGGRPVFADIDPRTCNIDPRQVEVLVNGETGAVIATHLQGLACDIEPIAALCRSCGIPLIEDAAQCLGGRVGERHVGTFGDAGIFSFSLKKNVNTLYGGFLVTQKMPLYESIRGELGSFPFESRRRIVQQAAKCLIGDILSAPPLFPLLTFNLLRNQHSRLGRRFQRLIQPEVRPARLERLPSAYRRSMTPLQAQLALRQIDRVDEDMRVRLRYAKQYHEGLSDLTDIALPPLREDGSHTYLTYPVQVADRRRFVNGLLRLGCDVRAQALTNTADLPCFADHARDCPQARRTAERVVLLPIYPRLGDKAVRDTVDAIRRYFGAGPRNTAAQISETP